MSARKKKNANAAQSQSTGRAAASKGSSSLPGIVLLGTAIVLAAVLGGALHHENTLREQKWAGALAQMQPISAQIESCAKRLDCLSAGPDAKVDLGLLPEGAIPCEAINCRVDGHTTVSVSENGEVKAEIDSNGKKEERFFAPAWSDGKLLWAENGVARPAASATARSDGESSMDKMQKASRQIEECAMSGLCLNRDAGDARVDLTRLPMGRVACSSVACAIDRYTVVSVSPDGVVSELGSDNRGAMTLREFSPSWADGRLRWTQTANGPDTRASNAGEYWSAVTLVERSIAAQIKSCARSGVCLSRSDAEERVDLRGLPKGSILCKSEACLVGKGGTPVAVDDNGVITTQRWVQVQNSGKPRSLGALFFGQGHESHMFTPRVANGVVEWDESVQAAHAPLESSPEWSAAMDAMQTISDQIDRCVKTKACVAESGLGGSVDLRHISPGMVSCVLAPCVLNDGAVVSTSRTGVVSAKILSNGAVSTRAYAAEVRDGETHWSAAPDEKRDPGPSPVQ